MDRADANVTPRARPRLFDRRHGARFARAAPREARTHVSLSRRQRASPRRDRASLYVWSLCLVDPIEGWRAVGLSPFAYLSAHGRATSRVDVAVNLTATCPGSLAITALHRAAGVAAFALAVAGARRVDGVEEHRDITGSLHRQLEVLASGWRGARAALGQQSRDDRRRRVAAAGGAPSFGTGTISAWADRPVVLHQITPLRPFGPANTGPAGAVRGERRRRVLVFSRPSHRGDRSRCSSCRRRARDARCAA